MLSTVFQCTGNFTFGLPGMSFASFLDPFQEFIKISVKPKIHYLLFSSWKNIAATKLFGLLFIAVNVLAPWPLT